MDTNLDGHEIKKERSIQKKKRGFIFQHTLIEILTLFLNSILAAI